VTSVLELSAAVEQLLATGAPLVDVYTGSVPDTVRLDDDGRAHVYAVIYPFPGQGTRNNLAGALDGVDWPFQVTCAGGDYTRALACLDAVRGALTGKRLPLPAGRSDTALLGEIGNAGQIREDSTAHPSRWWTALIFGALAPA
jgi:hypothetical protein